jgi:hypothetical protein
MAMNRNGAYGKDRVVRGSAGFIEHALTGGSGPSNEIVKKSIGRPDQTINTAFAMDNVKLAMPLESSVKDGSGWAGGVDNVKHSLTGTSAVNEEVGAAGAVKHVIIPNH